ncbi:hypothetical protein DI396_06180 [Litorivita pollutaquae]|uniref:D-galactarate dehydratase n=1 Tax=Litorivita pollutaquae TaxID=2200892 RepID=A0A2V4NF71_9RHOB|nr:hypothetical protein [Litorivita pollutaquae]PYC48550.1 hypothetical protein DI396_06180 [Litorivita pollutaquae]
MTHIVSRSVFLLCLAALAGCANPLRTAKQEAPVAAPQADMVAPTRLESAPKRPPASARTVEQFDTTTTQDRAAAVAAPDQGKGVLLGRSVTSLGAPTEAGFWVKTPLVTTRAKGRVTSPQTGNSVQVDLIPLGGEATGGSQISLAAMRLLGVALTDLPELDIYQQ